MHTYATNVVDRVVGRHGGAGRHAERERRDAGRTSLQGGQSAHSRGAERAATYHLTRSVPKPCEVSLLYLFYSTVHYLQVVQI